MGCCEKDALMLNTVASSSPTTPMAKRVRFRCGPGITRLLLPRSRPCVV